MFLVCRNFQEEETVSEVAVRFEKETNRIPIQYATGEVDRRSATLCMHASKWNLSPPNNK
jgi:hypothetical protein